MEHRLDTSKEHTTPAQPQPITINKNVGVTEGCGESNPSEEVPFEPLDLTPNPCGEVHEIAAQVAQLEQLRSIQNPQYFTNSNTSNSNSKSRNSNVNSNSNYDTNIDNHSAISSNLNSTTSVTKVSTENRPSKKKEFRKLEWKHLKTIFTANSPYGLLLHQPGNVHGRKGSNKPKPINITDEEKLMIANQNRELFPVGFYEMTCKTRGVTRGRGEWKDKETLKLEHCNAERNGCKFKVRYFRVITGIEVWTNGEHDYRKHKAPSKRGLSPDVRQYVTEHHRESQKTIMDGLIERGLISALDKASIAKIKQQIKRRKLTVKANHKIQNSLALQNDSVDVYNNPLQSVPILLQHNHANSELDGAIDGNNTMDVGCLEDTATATLQSIGDNDPDIHQPHSADHHNHSSIHVDDELVEAAKAAVSTGDFIYKDSTENMPTFV